MILGFVSAFTLTSTPTALTLNGDDSNGTLTISSDATTFTITSFNSSLTYTDSNSKTATVSIGVDDQTNVSSAIFTLNVSSVTSGFLIGDLTKTLTVNAKNDSNTSQTDPIDVVVTYRNSFCDKGSVNDTNLKLNVDINNLGDGDDDEWLPLDTIEIEVELENNDNVDLDNVVLELGLFKEGSSSNIIDDMMWISKDEEKIEIGDIDEDEEKKHTFEFRVDPTEVDDTDYIFVVKAYPEGDESLTCIDHSDNLDDFGTENFFADIQVSKENDRDKMVVVDEKSYPVLLNGFCGEQISFNADVYNIGDRNFEDQIEVILTNTGLGLNTREIANGDLDEGEKTDVTFSFKVPSNAVEKTHTLSMDILYDYDKDDDNYDRSSDDTFTALLKVAGNCESGSSSTGNEKATVSAFLESGGNAGEELKVKVTVTNTGSSTATYVLSPASYTEWASSASISPSTLTLNAGVSGEAIVTFDVKSDASEGDGTFNLEVVSGNELVVRQPVSVSIEKSSVLSGITGNLIGGNPYLWGIGLINVILIVAIVFVVIRLMRR
tara:strand:- start:1528 stop:3174 length:1647 start_codon:yes stop_codon:yes gene_type:complete